MSYDAVPEQQVEVQQPVQVTEAQYVEPLTRAEREELNELSLKAYGRKLAWQKMVRKGELKEETAMTSGGQPIKVKRLHQISVDEAVKRMQNVLKEREEQAKKAAEEAAAQAKGEENGESKETSEEQSSQVESSSTEVAGTSESST